jgi:hypothetical protein
MSIEEKKKKIEEYKVRLDALYNKRRYTEDPLRAKEHTAEIDVYENHIDRLEKEVEKQNVLDLKLMIEERKLKEAQKNEHPNHYFPTEKEVESDVRKDYELGNFYAIMNFHREYAKCVPSIMYPECLGSCAQRMCMMCVVKRIFKAKKFKEKLETDKKGIQNKSSKDVIEKDYKEDYDDDEDDEDDDDGEENEGDEDQDEEEDDSQEGVEWLSNVNLVQGKGSRIIIRDGKVRVEKKNGADDDKEENENDEALQILRKRYARGEITKQQYEEMKKVLSQ